MKVCMAAVLPAVMSVCLSGCKKTDTAVETAQSGPQLVNEFVIYGVDLATAPEIGGGDWINVGDLGTTAAPDSHFTGIIYPNSGIVASNDASLIFRLAPAATQFIVDGVCVDRAEAEKLTNDDIMVAALCDSIVMINTYPEGLNYNPVFEAATLAENAAYSIKPKS